MRPAYTHRQGVIYSDGKPITPAFAKETLAQHRKGAEAAKARRWFKIAEVSAALADQLETAIGAAEHFNKVTGRRGKSSTRVAITKGDAA